MTAFINDFSRHKQLFDPEQFDKPVTVLGVGATGSFLVLYLAKLGIKNITVYDFDVIEEHNVPNQVFGLQDIGKPKVEALYDLVKQQTGVEINVKNERYTRQRLSGYVFNCVDSMDTRKKVWLQSVKLKTAITHYVEPRIGLDTARIYNVTPMELSHHERYEATMYSDEEAEVSACGTSLSVVTSSAAIAGFCARQLVNHFNGIELSNEILYDFLYNNVIAEEW